MNPLSNHHDDPLAADHFSDELQLVAEEDSLVLADEEDSLALAPEDAVPEIITALSEESSPFIDPTTKTWKILIADDDKAIHEVTQLALQGFTFQGKPLTFLSAYSGQEAKTLLSIHADITLIFLDVMMENNNSGFEVVKYVRETLKNKFIRIVLRTGQPGEAPEESVILDYDINDYKLKTELTQRKLFTTLVVGLRTYHDLMTLEINKRFSKQVLESVPVGVVVHHADGSIHYANKRAIQLLGQEIVSQASSGITYYPLYLAGTDQPYPYKRMPVVLALQGQVISADDIEIRYAAQITPVEVWSTPVYDEQERIIQAIIAFQDITERKQAESDKIRLVQEQEAKNAVLCYSHEIEAKNVELTKLSQEKSEFLGIVAHDLKNPLSAILGLAEMIVENVVDNLPKAEIVEYAQGISLSAKQMFNLVVNLLDVNRIESGQFQVSLQIVDLSLLVQQVIHNYEERATAKQIQLHYEPPTEPYIGRLDADTTRQVLDNLISNAIKYSPYEKTVRVRLVQTERTIRCEIEDEGPGLSERDQQKLFGKFARLTAKPTGEEHSTGLGLFIVKKLVTAMKGQVWCESELGKGSTFIVEFARIIEPSPSV